MEHENGLLFASEIKTILKYPTVKAQLDKTGAAQLILLGPGRIPGSGVFHGIRELEPGWYGYYENLPVLETPGSGASGDICGYSGARAVSGL